MFSHLFFYTVLVLHQGTCTNEDINTEILKDAHISGTTCKFPNFKVYMMLSVHKRNFMKCNNNEYNFHYT